MLRPAAAGGTGCGRPWPHARPCENKRTNRHMKLDMQNKKRFTSLVTSNQHQRIKLLKQRWKGFRYGPCRRHEDLRIRELPRRHVASSRQGFRGTPPYPPANKPLVFGPSQSIAILRCFVEMPWEVRGLAATSSRRLKQYSFRGFRSKT